MRRNIRFPSLATLLAIVLVAAFAARADAKTKRFKPLDFVPESSSLNVVRSPLGVGGVGGNAYFHAPLGLPAGATITAMRMHSNGAAATRTATIVGRSIGTLAIGVANNSTSTGWADPYTPIVTAATLNALPALRVISADRLYEIELICSAGTAIWAVDVDYTP